MAWWLKDYKSHFCRNPRGTARVPLSSDQGERVIRLNPLFGSVSFASRLDSEQSILQPLIHQPGALSRDGRAGPSAGARMDGCHSSLWGVKGVVSYSDCGTSPANWGQSQMLGEAGRAKQTFLGDMPTAMGTFCLSHSKVTRCLMGFVAGTRSLGEESVVDKVMGFGKSYLLEKTLVWLFLTVKVKYDIDL